MIVFVFGLMVVFRYWLHSMNRTLPGGHISRAPGILGALLTIWARGISGMMFYFQIGLPGTDRAGGRKNALFCGCRRRWSSATGQVHMETTVLAGEAPALS